MAQLADIVVLGEVESQSELDQAIEFLTNFGLTVFPKHVHTSEAELKPGSALKEDSRDRYLVTCYQNDYNYYELIFKRCSAGYNSGEDRMLTGKRKVSPALWEVHRLPPNPKEDSALGLKVAKFRNALVFYANKSNYENTVILKYDYNDGFHTTSSPVVVDGGTKAREVLDGG